MTQTVEITGPFLLQGEIGEHVLRSLPGWFGIESAIVQYRETIDRLPTFVARRGDEVVGFFTVERHFPESAELHVLGVLEPHHGTGVGRALLTHAEEWLLDDGCTWLQVKTVAEARKCKYYDRTRGWYLAMGFDPLQVFPLLWDESNPCLQLVKRLDQSSTATRPG
ncbi:MAG: GNAT family N-acetyltransferase [Phycisphaerales bacterium]|nr:GNAT family N-acetyltransferase [Phycisphaerales bacterium]